MSRSAPKSRFSCGGGETGLKTEQPKMGQNAQVNEAFGGRERYRDPSAASGSEVGVAQ